MKFLAFVDFHHDPSDFISIKEKIKKHDPEFLICAGDFTWFGEKTEEILESFILFDKPIYIIHGNHEEKKEVKEICEKYTNLIFAHNKIIYIKDTLFVFYGGGGFSEKEPNFNKLIKKHKEEIKNSKKIVLITHAPPKNTILDKLSEDYHVGVIDYKRFIKNYSPNLAISGHIHESYKKQEKYKETLLINPGGDGEIFEI